MTTIAVAAERLIDGTAERVYGYLADYRRHHPRILPPAFRDFAVEQGGVGAGTVFRFGTLVAGRRRTYRMRAEEPEPGRVLLERDLGSSLVTTFTVTPEGTRCRVRIATTWQGGGGPGGLFERLFAPPVFRRVYADELRRLNRYALEHAAD